MYLSVILSTYNQPEWLEKVIWGYAAQNHRDFELVIADDGSTGDTRDCIDQLRVDTGLAIRHVWHADHGFRKCTILNRAIVQANADYLVFSDGDCIPRFDFLATHARFARPGRFLSGGYFKLPLELSQLIARDDILAGQAANVAWLQARGLPWSLKKLKVSAGPRLARLLDHLTTTKATWNGHNSSGWKADILRVNGFDERMEWGGEDREMGERLMNIGIRGKRIRYRAICVHLDHPRGYVRQTALVRNRQIRSQTRQYRTAWTNFGIVRQQTPLPQHAV
ncbi:MAG: glycosyltransferase family 2 protein [Pirellulales bacterium]|nr:glycosyltransferase family 2 protein [Pirellulales bacterium]